ncbi:DUF1566 domain-containing protein [Candidatus Woesearchaeota archaeon]|nr:DUF1566 domain-containing protein [Candidatus Woesearchaeota archaeon]
MAKDKKAVIGWIAVAITLLIASLWAWWGILENFHEGWYSASLLENLLMLFIQYLSFSIVFIILAIISIYYKKVGAALFIALALFSVFFFNMDMTVILFILPFLLMLGAGFYFGKINNKKLAIYLIIGIPVLIILGFGIPNLLKVGQRANDNNFGLRVIEGNGIALTWAPKGIGFPEEGTDWNKAGYNCLHLSEDGTRLEDAEQNIWHLPTKEEIVRSLTRKDKNAGGTINPQGKPEYRIQPDKETPLWDPNSKIIYYWTSEEKDKNYSFMVSYNGQLLWRSKTSGAGYHGYRCVKEI